MSLHRLRRREQRVRRSPQPDDHVTTLDGTLAPPVATTAAQPGTLDRDRQNAHLDRVERSPLQEGTLTPTGRNAHFNRTQRGPHPHVTVTSPRLQADFNGCPAHRYTMRRSSRHWERWPR